MKTFGRRPCTEEEAVFRGFSGRENARRREILAETICAFEQAKPRDYFHRLAQDNHARWAAQAEYPGKGLVVRIEGGDWGAVTQSASQRFGQIFAVLNMANAFIPGGGYIEGAPAQEENIYRRTDCHFYIRDADYDRQADRYRSKMTELISGSSGRVYLDAEHPRVCIRGEEDFGQPDLGYRWLDDDEVFFFYELRSAAQDLRRGAIFDPDLARRQIAAQLDTLSDAGLRHAVLGAFGCGAFRNPAGEVARLYREEIEQRRADFDVIYFAILGTSYSPNNAAPFQSAFNGF